MNTLKWGCHIKLGRIKRWPQTIFWDSFFFNTERQGTHLPPHSSMRNPMPPLPKAVPEGWCGGGPGCNGPRGCRCSSAKAAPPCWLKKKNESCEFCELIKTKHLTNEYIEAKWFVWKMCTRLHPVWCSLPHMDMLTPRVPVCLNVCLGQIKKAFQKNTNKKH